MGRRLRGRHRTEPTGPTRRRAAHRAKQASRADAEARAAARLDGWARAVSAALDDDQLADAITAVTAPVAGLDRRSIGLTRAQLLTWAITVATTQPHRPVADALTEALQTGTVRACVQPPLQDVPEPPATPTDAHAADLTERIRRALDRGIPHVPPTAVSFDR